MNEKEKMEKTENKPAAFSNFSRVAKSHPSTMLDLFKMYIYRLLHSKMIFVLYAIVALIALIAVGVMFQMNAQAAKRATELGIPYVPQASISQIALWCFSIPLASLSVTSLSAGSLISAIATSSFPLGVLSVIAIAFFIGKDWRNRTFRNQILAGHSRFEIYMTAMIVSLIIALGFVVVWEFTLWVFGLAFQLPAFIDGQFDYVLTSSNTQVVANAPAVFALSFFMSLLIYLVVAVVACAWCFIIPNSWGAIGLLYATAQLFNFVALVVFLTSQANNCTYYQFEEWLTPYQLGLFTSFIPDLRGGYVFVDQGGYSYWRMLTYGGRVGFVCLKTVISSLVLAGGMGYLGCLAFAKRDLK